MATLEIRGGKERTNNRTTLGGHIVVEGGDGSIFVYQGHVGMIEGGFSGVCRIGVGGRAHPPFVADSQRPMMSLDWTDTPAEFTRQTPVRGKMTLKSGVRREILWR